MYAKPNIIRYTIFWSAKFKCYSKDQSNIKEFQLLIQ